MPWFAITSYVTAAIVYGLTASILLVNAASRKARVLVIATSASALWATTIACLILWKRTSDLQPLVVVDAIHLFVWIVAMALWLDSRSLTRWAGLLAGIVTFWVALAGTSFDEGSPARWSALPGVLLLALGGFLIVEQVQRNTAVERRRSALLCFAAGGLFMVDLFTYSQACITGGLTLPIWDARGLANAAVAPLVLYAVKGENTWEREIIVSRHLAFYTAGLLGLGAYLLAMAVAAYLIEHFGGAWGASLEIVFLVAAILLFGFVLVSPTVRSQGRAFVIKHFYSHKYDYRREWLRLTQALGRSGELSTLAENGLSALANIVGGPKGDIWVDEGSGRYEWKASFGSRRGAQEPIHAEHPLVRFLVSCGWVVDTEEYRREPARYGNAFGDAGTISLPPDSLIVPLDCQGALQGIVVLQKPAGVGALNFEDHDILKTAGRQIGVVLGQAIALEKLAETRQFEAMNKLSTFLMHDLKNIVAQQELVVANAQRFKHRPDFVDDAFATIRSSVERMKRVLDQLREAAQQKSISQRADMSKAIVEARSACSDRNPVPELAIVQKQYLVPLDREKLVSALTHLIRNAQDATPPDGRICITLTEESDDLVLAVQDTGCGMNEAFVRDRLFRPFDSTKGARGMGIGAYQVREIIRAAGGDVEVQSEVGRGTRFGIRLPRLQA